MKDYKYLYYKYKNKYKSLLQKGGMESEGDGGGPGGVPGDDGGGGAASAASVDIQPPHEEKKDIMIHNILLLIKSLKKDGRYRYEGLFRGSSDEQELNMFKRAILSRKITSDYIETLINADINNIHLISSGIKYILSELCKLKLFGLVEGELKPLEPKDEKLKNVYNEFYLLVNNIIDFTNSRKLKREESEDITVNTLDILGFANMIYMIFVNGLDDKDRLAFGQDVQKMNKYVRKIKADIEKKRELDNSSISKPTKHIESFGQHMPKGKLKQIKQDKAIRELDQELAELNKRNAEIKIRMAEPKFTSNESLLKCGIHNNKESCETNHCNWEENKCNPKRSWTNALTFGLYPDIDPIILREFKQLQEESNDIQKQIKQIHIKINEYRTAL
jgi:hypothetical protein